MLNLGPFPTEASIAAAIAAALSTTTIAQTSAIVGDDLELVRGDDFNADNEREITFALVATPSVTGAAVTMILTNILNGSTALTITGSVVSATEIFFEITSEQTAQLDLGSPSYEYIVTAVLADGAEITIVRGNVVVTE